MTKKRAPNPMIVNPWGHLTDAEIGYQVRKANERIDAAEHTKQSLLRELARRNTALGLVRDIEGRNAWEPGAFKEGG